MNEYKTVSLSLARYDDMSELKDSRMDAFCFLLRSFDCCLDRPSAADTCRNKPRPTPVPVPVPSAAAAAAEEDEEQEVEEVRMEFS